MQCVVSLRKVHAAQQVLKSWIAANENGIHGEAGEENGGATCLVDVTKPLIILASGGAAATQIDARGTLTSRTVCINSNDVEFGRPGKGFTVTASAMTSAWERQ